MTDESTGERFLCAPSVFSVSLWWVICGGLVNHRDTENTEGAQRKNLDAKPRRDILPPSQADNLFPGVAVIPSRSFQRRLQAVNAQ